MTEPLTCQRHHFELDHGVHYLNCAYMGPLPRVAREAGEAGLGGKSRPWSITADDFFNTSAALRERFGRLVGGSADRVAIQPSVSYGIATVARNVELGVGGEIVLLGEQFPGNVYAWQRIADEQSGKVVFVDRPDATERGDGSASVGAVWTERILEAINERTRVVAVPPVHWTDGTRFDLKAIGERAREVGAWFVVDATQALGALPFDVEDIQPDFLTAGAYKWLLGPYAVALAWAGPRLNDGVPIEETWIGRKDSEDFKGLVDYTAEYQPGAVRYDFGERSNFALLPVAVAALDLILEWEPERISSYIDEISRPLHTAAVELGYGLEESAWRSRHLFGLKMPSGVDLVDLKSRLEASRVFVSLRGASLRLSPNVYNTPEDIAALIEVLGAAR